MNVSFLKPKNKDSSDLNFSDLIDIFPAILNYLQLHFITVNKCILWFNCLDLHKCIYQVSFKKTRVLYSVSFVANG